MIVKKLEINKLYDFKKPINDFVSKKTPENLYKKKIELKDEVVYIIIFERYFFRINSDLSLTIVIHQAIDKTTIEIIASGGGVGLLSDDWGSEEKALSDLYNVLIKDGFKEIK